MLLGRKTAPRQQAIRFFAGLPVEVGLWVYAMSAVLFCLLQTAVRAQPVKSRRAAHVKALTAGLAQALGGFALVFYGLEAGRYG